MKKVLAITLALILALLMLTACDGGKTGSANATATANAGATASPKPVRTLAATNPPQAGANANIPAGAEEIMQGVYYYELYEIAGDSGDGATPREGAEMVVNDVLMRMDFFDMVGPNQCVYISLDDLQFLDSAMGRECYIYTVAIGTISGGFMGDDYRAEYLASVDYGEWSAALYEDFSGDWGDAFEDYGDGDIYTDAPYWDGEFVDRDAGFSITVMNFDGISYFDFEIYFLRNGGDVLDGFATISSDTDYTAEFGELLFVLYADNSAIELSAPSGSGWEHLSGTYERIYQ